MRFLASIVLILRYVSVKLCIRQEKHHLLSFDYSCLKTIENVTREAAGYRGEAWFSDPAARCGADATSAATVCCHHPLNTNGSNIGSTTTSKDTHRDHCTLMLISVAGIASICPSG